MTSPQRSQAWAAKPSENSPFLVTARVRAAGSWRRWSMCAPASACTKQVLCQGVRAAPGQGCQGRQVQKFFDFLVLLPNRINADALTVLDQITRHFGDLQQKAIFLRLPQDAARRPIAQFMRNGGGADFDIS